MKKTLSWLYIALFALGTFTVVGIMAWLMSKIPLLAVAVLAVFWCVLFFVIVRDAFLKSRK